MNSNLVTVESKVIKVLLITQNLDKLVDECRQPAGLVCPARCIITAPVTQFFSHDFKPNFRAAIPRVKFDPLVKLELQ
jgi:hypothetical protein